MFKVLTIEKLSLKTVVDMFPRTGWVDNMFPDVHRLVSTHVETIVLLSKI